MTRRRSRQKRETVKPGPGGARRCVEEGQERETPEDAEDKAKGASNTHVMPHPSWMLGTSCRLGSSNEIQTATLDHFC